MAYLSSEFLAKYEGLRPKNAGPLFEVTYLSKYSRWLEDKKRRETWGEIIQRVVEYNVELDQTLEHPVQEAELMYDNLFHLYTYPAGRTYWVGGTEASKKWGESNFNCCFTIIDEVEDFCDIFHLLMVGSGVGFRILREDVAKLPKLHDNFNVQHVKYEKLKASDRQEFTTVESTGDNHLITVGDSKEGWVEALREYLNLLTTMPPLRDRKLNISINYNHVRPKKSRIKTFGGRAAGHTGLKKMFSRLHEIISASSGSLRPIDCLDIITIIADAVLVGGIRRAALIALASPDDQEFIDAKLYEHLQNNPNRKKSNNSIVFSEELELSKIEEVLERVRQSWEPGFFNLKAASARRENVAGCNPCGEILLADKGVCNLTGTYLTSHILDDKSDFNWESLEKSHRLAARIGLRQTNITISLPEWDATQKRDRLLGVSVTGLGDALDTLGYAPGGSEEIELYKKLSLWANDEADKYADSMGVNRPLLVTCVKPEGTISLLPTSSCGMHKSYAPMFKRRYWMANSDPICQALIEAGVEHELDLDANGENPSDKTIFTFYINSGSKMAANDEPATQQLDRYLNLMKYKVDHNASCTLTVGDDEWSLMADAIHKNQDSIVAIALGNKNMAENLNYLKLPYEAITEGQWKDNPDLSNLHVLINKYETEEYEDDDIEMNVTQQDCAGGACPLR